MIKQATVGVCAFGLTASVLSAQSAQTPQQGTAPKANQTVTITGCLAAGANNMFTLTASPAAANQEAPTGTTATTPAGSKVAKTITYTLSTQKPEELKGHVGHTVQVTGVEAAPQVVTGSTDKSQGAANAQGTSGGAKPNVETTTQTQIVARQLTVNSVKMVSANCSLVK